MLVVALDTVRLNIDTEFLGTVTPFSKAPGIVRCSVHRQRITGYCRSQYCTYMRLAVMSTGCQAAPRCCRHAPRSKFGGENRSAGAMKDSSLFPTDSKTQRSGCTVGRRALQDIIHSRGNVEYTTGLGDQWSTLQMHATTYRYAGLHACIGMEQARFQQHP